MISKSVIHLYSGGLDSTVLLYDLHKQAVLIHCLLFDYGQIHRAELRYAKNHCEALRVKWTQIDLVERRLFKTSAICGGDGSDIVPNRNAIFLHIAAALAISAHADCVTIGCNKQDRSRFPDCSERFLASINRSLQAAKVPIEICAPYIQLTKRQIVKIGQRLEVPYANTLSCYLGVNCGKCDACIKRKEALA